MYPLESKCPDEILRMPGYNLNMYILRMLEVTFLLGAPIYYIQLKEHDALGGFRHCVQGMVILWP